MKRIEGIYFGLLMIFLAGCSQGDMRLKVDVSHVTLPLVTIHRYDADLFRIDKDQLREGLEVLKPEYRFFLDTDLGDPAKLLEMRSYLESPRTLGFQAAVAEQYKQVDWLEKELTLAFQHCLYYYPGMKIPRVYGYISGGDYNYPVQYADSVLLIGLDNFLGSSFKPYIADGLPAYRISRMTPENIVPECMKVVGNITYPEQLPGNTLLEQMIDAGKRLLFIDAMIPLVSDHLKIGYSKAQYDWIVKNENHVWAAIIENRILYTTDGKLIRSFMADGPFTPEFSKDAPARLGEWLGWQIVRRYFERQKNVTLQQLMEEKDAQKILSLSGYKPEK